MSGIKQCIVFNQTCPEESRTSCSLHLLFRVMNTLKQLVFISRQRKYLRIRCGICVMITAVIITPKIQKRRFCSMFIVVIITHTSRYISENVAALSLVLCAFCPTYGTNTDGVWLH